MNRLRTPKFKSNLETDKNNDTNPSNNNAGSGLFNKLTKRYSTLSSKITRRHLPGRKSQSPQRIVSGSYDMTGANSEDHRLEIGAPVLISTTTLDTDRFGVTEARLKQIGGGIAVTNTEFQTVNLATVLDKKFEADATPNIVSSGSENEIYMDAKSGSPQISNKPMMTDEEEKYDSAVETHKPASEPAEEHYVVPRPIINCSPISIRKSLSSTNTDDNNSSAKESSPELLNISSKSCDNGVIKRLNEVTPPSTLYEFSKSKKSLSKKQHSKSAHNLHRSELRMHLAKAPSVALDMNLTTADLNNCHDLPKLSVLYGESLDHTENSDADKENSSPSVILKNKSEPNTPMTPDQRFSGYLLQQQTTPTHFKSIDSLDIHRNVVKRRNVELNMSTNSIEHSSDSKQSLATSNNSTLDGFNLKSVSCQSLNAQSLFVSIDELNEITRQINEAEEFNQEMDLEYCLHRDNLKPNERRITLLKNKNQRLMNLAQNKEKIKKGWHGVKHWIGEESNKFKEVVQKQSTLQRVASSRLNLSLGQAECRSSPSVNGSMSLRPNTSLAESTSNITVMARSTGLLDASCDNIVECEQDDDELECSFRTNAGEPNSPVTKRPRREGQNGFEELRRYVKQGGDFGKELILILQERVDAELLYSKSLSKMATKLSKACRELPGSIADAWRGVATEMESRSDVHRQLSTSLTDEIVKPLKTIVDGHHKTRKTVESNVDKSARTLSEWRASEAKAKKTSHTAARENEKLQDAMLDVRIQKSPSLAILHQGNNKIAAEKEIKSAEKDCAKLDNKRKKAEEAVKRADVEYYTLCVRAERARVDWEMAVLRGSSLLQNIESQRLVSMKNFATNYTVLTANMNPLLETLVHRLQPQIEACNVVKDMQVIKNIRRNSEGPSEQLLPDFYCEHTTLAMNRERRKHALIKLLQLVKTDLERERRSRIGLKGLSQSLNNQDNQNITDKLYHIRSMLTYLEGSRFKLHSALLELDHKPRSAHPLAQHIQTTRDRTGLQQSILKVPLWLKNDDKMNCSTTDDIPIAEHEYDVILQTNTSANNSALDSNKEESVSVKSFNRSKSNLETFRSKNNITIITNSKKSNAEDPYSDRGQADGGSNQQDSDFDEFSSQDEEDSSSRREHNKAAILKSVENHYQNAAELQATNCKPVVLSRCKALYSYTPKLYDELELKPGDVIEVHAKQEDGWWLGALGKNIGIFPATYVEEYS